MIRTYLIPFLAIAGIVWAIITVVQGSKPPVAQPPLIEPPRAPFAAFVAGSGLVEASTENIAVTSAVGGKIMSVSVDVGQTVKRGDELFRVDDRDLVAQLAVAKASVRVAQEQVARLEAGTRPEQIPPARARVAEAEALLADAKDQLAMWTQVEDPRAVSEQETRRRRFNVTSAEARLEQSRADLALLEAGTWQPEIAIARSQVEAALAEVARVETEIERRVARAPVDGMILQLNARPGEFAPAGEASEPLVLMGDVTRLHVRVDIDENEAWRVQAGRPAACFVRGNKNISAPLTFVEFEPFVVPKRSLTGESTERVDTRVLQVIYSFDPAAMRVFVGQQVDVYIEAEPIGDAFRSGPTQTPPGATPAPPAAAPGT
jgi:multidrug efflux pump subunit AcrA (membrane-fusion protein)